MRFTPEEIAKLAEAERMMDSGKVPFVMWRGERMMVDEQIMAELGLERGQTVSDVIAAEITRASLRQTQAKIAMDRIRDKDQDPSSE